MPFKNILFYTLLFMGVLANAQWAPVDNAGTPPVPDAQLLKLSVGSQDNIWSLWIVSKTTPQSYPYIVAQWVDNHWNVINPTQLRHIKEIADISATIDGGVFILEAYDAKQFAQLKHSKNTEEIQKSFFEETKQHPIKIKDPTPWIQEPPKTTPGRYTLPYKDFKFNENEQDKINKRAFNKLNSIFHIKSNNASQSLYFWNGLILRRFDIGNTFSNSVSTYDTNTISLQSALNMFITYKSDNLTIRIPLIQPIRALQILPGMLLKEEATTRPLATQISSTTLLLDEGALGNAQEMYTLLNPDINKIKYWHYVATDNILWFVLERNNRWQIIQFNNSTKHEQNIPLIPSGLYQGRSLFAQIPFSVGNDNTVWALGKDNIMYQWTEQNVPLVQNP